MTQERVKNTKRDVQKRKEWTNTMHAPTQTEIEHMILYCSVTCVSWNSWSCLCRTPLHLPTTKSPSTVTPRRTLLNVLVTLLLNSEGNLLLFYCTGTLLFVFLYSLIVMHVHCHTPKTTKSILIYPESFSTNNATCTSAKAYINSFRGYNSWKDFECVS